MSEKNTPKQTALFVILSLCPIGLLFGIQGYLAYLQPQFMAFSPFVLTLFFAQLLCSIVFIKGEICPGQRGRLIKVHSLFSLFWLGVLFEFPAVALCGLLMSLLAFKQPKENINLRQKLLYLGVVAGIVGSLSYLIAGINASLNWLVFSPFSQLLLGTVLANMALVVSKNRLQGFIALLPFLMALLLTLNVIFVLTLLASQSAVHFANEFALVLYFGLHLLIMAILSVVIIGKIKLDYPALMILFLLSLSLPLWAAFAEIA